MNDTAFNTFFEPSLGVEDQSTFGFALSMINFNNSEHFNCLDGKLVDNTT